MPDSQGPEVLLRPAPRFSQKQIFSALFLAIFLLISVFWLLGSQGLTLRTQEVGQQAEEEVAILTPEEVAQKYGYKIHYKQVWDMTGRTVVTKDRGVFDLWGRVSRPEEDGAITHIWGQVGSIEEIAGSDDLVVSIINPVENEELGRVRIDRTKPSLEDAPNLEVFTTPVYVDDLAGPFEAKRAGYAGEWEGDFGKLLAEGDFLGVGIALTWEDPVAKTGKLVPSRDDRGNLLVSSIVIRRIGGKEAVLNDLSN